MNLSKMNSLMIEETKNNTLEYCKNLFESEVSRIDIIERKAQFQLTLFTIFIGVIFFKLDKFSDIFKTIASQNLIPHYIFSIAFIVSFVALFFSLLFIFAAMSIRKWDLGIPDDVYKYIFEEKSRAQLCEKLIETYYHAWEYNKAINDRKAKHLKISSILLVMAIFIEFSIVFLIGIVSK